MASATITESVELATMLEPVAVKHGFHIGVGGGTVNKTGPRKDIDIIIYRRRDSRQAGTCSSLTALLKDFPEVEFVSDLIEGLERWCTKALWRNVAVDFLFPESPAGEYENK